VAVLQLAVEDIHHQDAARSEAARRFVTQPSEDLDRWVTMAGLDTEAVRQRVQLTTRAA
jgi:hypothetical protein